MMRNINATRALAIAAGLVIVALTGAAFWLSYAHLAEVALGHGLEQAPVRAWAWPACLDLFIMAGELMWLRAAIIRRVDWWAIVLTAAGSLGSIALNVAGVGSSAQLLDYVVAAVPPTAALLAFGALMRQIHQALAERVEVGQSDPAERDNFVYNIREVEPPEVTVDHFVGADKVTTEVTAPATDREKTTPDLESFPEPLEVVTRPVIELPAVTPVWDDFATSKVTTVEPRRVVVPEVTAVDPWADKFPFQTTIGQPPAKVSAVPAAETRQVVTEPISLTPNELRVRARRLHRKLVKSGERGVTIDRLREEFGLSRREATDLRRDVLLAEMMTGGRNE